MKGSTDRTKVVLRHLPPSISQAMLIDQLDPKFSGRYNWISFFPGNSSKKHVVHSRAYINFNKAEDVIEFAEFFNGHVFVNEKGAQYKAVVEYAPSQNVPKKCSKKDGRQGTILKDPAYVEFLEFIGKPAEHLPSAEIQLERREAEQAAAGKEALIITPLMHYIRQKRAASSGSRRSLTNGKSVRRNGRRPCENPHSGSSKQSERRRVTSSMYVVRDTTKVSKGKDKSADDPLVSKREDQQCSDKTVLSGGSYGDDVSIYGTGTADIGKKKILLLKGKERDLAHGELSSAGNLRPNPQRESSGKIMKSILLPDRLKQSSKVEGDRQSQSSNIRILSKSRNGVLDGKVLGNDSQVAEKIERRTRNKDRPDRGVWTPLRQSDGLLGSDGSSSSASQSVKIPPPSLDGYHGVQKVDNSSARSEVKVMGIARNLHSSIDNGSPIQVSRRRLSQGRKDTVVNVHEGKSARRGTYSQEKQVWVQKSSGSS